MKFPAIFCFAAILFLIGCPASENTKSPVKDTDVVVVTPSPTASNTVSDAELKRAVEDNLKKKNLTGVTVEVKDGEVTLRGTVPIDKYAEANMAATQEKPKNVINLLLAK